MMRVTIEELQKDLLRYLDAARNGEVVEISDGESPIAELRPPRIAGLEPGLAQDARAYLPSPLRRPVPSADLLDAERGDPPRVTPAGRETEPVVGDVLGPTGSDDEDWG